MFQNKGLPFALLLAFSQLFCLAQIPILDYSASHVGQAELELEGAFVSDSCGTELNYSMDCDESTGVLAVTVEVTGDNPPFTIEGDFNGSFENGDSFVHFPSVFASTVSLSVTDATDCNQLFDLELEDCPYTGPCTPAVSYFGESNQICDSSSGLVDLHLTLWIPVGFSTTITVHYYEEGSGDLITIGEIPSASSSEIITLPPSVIAVIEVLVSECSDLPEVSEFFIMDCEMETDSCGINYMHSNDCNADTDEVAVTFEFFGGNPPLIIEGDFDGVLESGDAFTVTAAPEQILVFEVTDALLCTQQISHTVPECWLPGGDTCDIDLSFTTECQETSGNIAIEFEITGSYPPFSVEGDAFGIFENGETFSFEVVNNYPLQYSITDALGCSDIFTIPAIACPPETNCPAALIWDLDLECNQEEGTATVSFEFVGINPPFSLTGDVNAEGFDYSDHFSFETITGNFVELYVTDALDCVEEISFIAEDCFISNPCENEIIVEFTQECNEESGVILLTAEFSGGNAPFQVEGAFTGAFELGEVVSFETNGNEPVELIVTDFYDCEAYFFPAPIDCPTVDPCQGNLIGPIDQTCDDFVNVILSFEFIGSNPPFAVEVNGMLFIGYDTGEIFSFSTVNDVSHQFIITDALACTQEIEVVTDCENPCWAITGSDPIQECDTLTGLIKLDFSNFAPPEFEFSVVVSYMEADGQVVMLGEFLDWTEIPALPPNVELSITIEVLNFPCGEFEYSLFTEDCEASQPCDLQLEYTQECDENTGLVELEFTIAEGVPPFQLTGDLDFDIDEAGTYSLNLDAGQEISFTLTDANECTEDFSWTIDSCEIECLSIVALSSNVCFENGEDGYAIFDFEASSIEGEVYDCEWTFYNESQQMIAQVSSDFAAGLDQQINVPHGSHSINLTITFEEGQCVVTQEFFLDTSCDPTGLSDKWEMAILLYPIPAKETLTLTLKEANYASLTIILYDIMGKAVSKEINWNSVNNVKMEIPINDLPSGTYFLELRSAENRIGKRFMKY